MRKFFNWPRLPKSVLRFQISLLADSQQVENFLERVFISKGERAFFEATNSFEFPSDEIKHYLLFANEADCESRRETFISAII